MTKRTDYPAGVPCFVDSGRVDSAAARDFYGGLLGWEFENVSPGGDAPPYHMAKLGGAIVAGLGHPARAGLGAGVEHLRERRGRRRHGDRGGGRRAARC